MSAICNENWSNLRESLARFVVHRYCRDLEARVALISKSIFLENTLEQKYILRFKMQIFK